MGHEGCWALLDLSMARVLSIVLCLFTGVAPLRASLVVTGVTTSTTSGSSSTAEGYTFENAQNALTSLTTASSTYDVASQSDNVFVRRNAVNNNQSSVWYTSSGVGTNLSGIHQNDYGQMLTSNNIFAGS